VTLKWKTKGKGTDAVIELAGDIEAGADQDLRGILGAVKAAHVDLDCANIGSINSVGVRDFLNFVAELGKRAEPRFHNCPSNFVDFIFLMSFAKLAGKVQSAQVDYHCTSCGTATAITLSRLEMKVLVKFPTQKCRKCGQPVDADADLERYHLIAKD
jgi:hypothetical protein